VLIKANRHPRHIGVQLVAEEGSVDSNFVNELRRQWKYAARHAVAIAVLFLFFLSTTIQDCFCLYFFGHSLIVFLLISVSDNAVCFRSHHESG